MRVLRWPAVIGCAVCVSAVASAQRTPPRTYANPIDIDYRYNFEQQDQGISYRSGADPVIVVQRGRYYLFETLGGRYDYGRLRLFRAAMAAPPPA